MEDKILKQLKELVEIQGSDGNWNSNSYMYGMYNGMELMLATIEGRDPIYRNTPDFFTEDKFEAAVGIKMRNLITNGMYIPETIKGEQEEGYKVLMVGKAKDFHPYAAESDTIFFMAKPIDKEKYDEYMKVTLAESDQANAKG